MNLFGRILFCGGISQYGDGDDPSRLPGPPNYSQILMKRLRVQGFLVLDPKPEISAKHVAELIRLKGEGKLKIEIDGSRKGFENLPKALAELFEGKNTGKLIVHA
jgi:NADPH-dependent curcumin reductase CurA